MGSSSRPDVSVCVTTYQHAPYIRACMESVLRQDFAGTLELLVGDDGSTDGTRQVVTELAAQDARVIPVFHVRNLGPTGNLDALVRRARGRAIAHLDGDDAWAPEKLTRQWEVLSAEPAVAAVYTNADVVTPDDRWLGLFNRGVRQRVDLRELLRRGNFLNHSSLLYRAEAIDAVLGMNPPWIDYRLHIRLSAHGALAYVDRPLVVHRWRTATSMIRSMPRTVIDGHLDAFEEALQLGACRADVLRAAGHAWGKTFVQAVISRRLVDVRYFSRRLSTIVDPSFAWHAHQLLLAPMRSMRSVTTRRGGVYFP